MDKDLALLHQKIDYLTEQIEAQKQRQQELDALKNDLMPIANHMIKLSIDELAEISRDFQLEDLLFLLKRLLRNTHSLIDLLDRLESATDLIDDANYLGKEVFTSTIATLDRLERDGYFDFMREIWNILDRIVHELSPEEFQALGDNIVMSITTMRNLTQPEILSLANNAVNAISNGKGLDKAPSLFALMRELSNPQVRKGLARMINLVKALADQPKLVPINETY
jgi:uncharacterized protein YjgD (DUF1641 family)